MNKRRRKQSRQVSWNSEKWRKRIKLLFQTARLTSQEREFLTKCYSQDQLNKRQEELLQSIEQGYSIKPIKKRTYPGYNIPGYDIPNRQSNLIKELNRPDLQAV